MGPQNLKFGGGVSGTVLHPAVLAAVIVAGILICIAPRQKATFAFLAASILIPTDQVLVLGRVHFPMLRVLIVFAVIRIVQAHMSSQVRLFSHGLNKIDVAVVSLTVVTALSNVALFQESAVIVNQVGNIYSVFGAYFLLRFLIRDDSDVMGVIRVFAYLAIFVAAIMTYEFTTGHNPYALLGGARASVYASLVERDNRFRAEGPFAHSILAGTFGAILVPLFIALWWKTKKHRKLIVAGAISATVITATSNSSTPVLAYAGGLLALGLWPLRRWMRVMRWGIVLTLISLHLVMKSPVWHLICRIDITGGSSSWHRYMLIDQCIRHFGDWWLIGVKETSSWGWDMWDTANQYVGTAEGAGLLALILFLAAIVYGFKYLGKARQAAKGRKDALFLWALTAAVFANAVAFFGVSYFDQTIVAWYALLAVIPAASAFSTKAADTRVRVQLDSSVPSAVLQLPLDSVESGRLAAGLTSGRMA
jgi:hypothetical protein